MSGKAIITSHAFLYQPKNKTRLSAYGGQRHQNYLKNFKKALYTSLLASGKLSSYLADIDERAQERMCLLVMQMAKQEQITERLKDILTRPCCKIF